MWLSAIFSSAMEKLADFFKHAISLGAISKSLHQNLPSISRKPEEWPLFYSAYEMTSKSFSVDDMRKQNSLEEDAFKVVKHLLILGEILK